MTEQIMNQGAAADAASPSGHPGTASASVREGLWAKFKITEEQRSYLAACARIRNISTTSMLKRLVEAICRDQMVAAILDDQEAMQRKPGEHSYRAHWKKPTA